MRKTPEIRAAAGPAPALLPVLLAVSLLAGGALTVSCAVDAEDERPSGSAVRSAGDGEPTGDPAEVLARVGDEEITRSEVEEAAGDRLDQIDKQLVQCQVEARKGRHDLVEGQTRQMVRERLLAAEAESRGVTQDELLQAEVQSRASDISEADVDAFYAENQARIGQPKEAIAGQIRQFLRQQRESEAYEEFISGLEERETVEYTMGPYRVQVAAEGAPAKGPADAPVTIVEFSDFECPYCSRVVPTLDRVKEEYGDRVRLVFKQYPLPIHGNAQKAAEASLCAHDQGEFWAMHDAMFADQRNLGPDGLAAMAEGIGLEMEAFRQCLSSGKYEAAVKEDLNDGLAVGVSGTPAMFVNGRMISGAVPYEQIAEVVEEELEESGGR
jgi:protein-disulfide isomerase